LIDETSICNKKRTAHAAALWHSPATHEQCADNRQSNKEAAARTIHDVAPDTQDPVKKEKPHE
jgi:hypothetical protein